MKIGTEVTLKISSNVVGDSNDENNFPHKLLLTNTQVSKLHKAFSNGSSADIKLSITQLHKIGQSGEFLLMFGVEHSLHLRQNFGILKTSVKIQFNYLFCFS